MKQDARFISVKILNRFEKKNEQLVMSRNQVFSSFKPESIDKSRAMVLTNEVIRLRDRLDLMIEDVSGRKINRLDPSLLSILRVGFYEIIYDESIPDYAAVDSLVNLTKTVLSRKASKLTNAVLRNLIRYRDKDSNWDESLKKKPKWVSLPIWLQKKWKYQFGESGFFALVNCINQNPKIFVRVDLTKNTVDDAKESLLESGIEVENYSDSFLKILTGSGKIFSTDLFQSGQVSIQNPAAGAIVEFLDPLEGEIVLDVCAAPGTKSLFIAERVGEKGRVLASDLDQLRANRGKNDLDRHRRKNIEWSVKDATQDNFIMADKILIDAPCTGTGVIGRKPDIRWRRKPKDISDMATLQMKLLKHMSQFLNDGGTLVYGTCSMEPEENWNVVEQFLKLNADFKLMTGPSQVMPDWINEMGCLSTFPHIHGVDGLFAARITRS
ncbi:MAG: 16S rRNA (cytosine(967)-C(5))-methyltransferase RsmB [Candidatus Marinimicrobia bacterium]|jgi:16S rRNA (cytosine967-C5)-methyltransferase|nr:16S rRNA (cytosine(967)-C(5))-methyltransferase RsmB [Candidatus Neomarinimicrobiota bacterium]MBT3847717.1 16S rRNA (cytosine(967)-C(5))-methyltransferase RsmB [Candidatus Neomarinimicrobiota bacterium]MBT4054522.1 16S rRNA (cytosine(967)-C(5))-methyltransferase RsmB [Candidatus Neomarinimicrobiota bacterium]MBT4370042.1 16S rRNA (cytosine(967)-C(5))-methyltransferase RsmB [Candidatus Neomarinimicrobiota bacterium]MBT4663079.1 16S rRNA (cytosine(967)-C(5))-methyltransferase RsmB [Candidatus